MPPKQTASGIDSIFIEGCAAKGISDFTLNTDALNEYCENEIMRSLHALDPLTFEYTVKIDKQSIMKISGAWDWVIDNCRSKRIAHLIKYGKNKKIRWKNFKRGIHIIAKELK